MKRGISRESCPSGGLHSLHRKDRRFYKKLQPSVALAVGRLGRENEEEEPMTRMPCVCGLGGGAGTRKQTEGMMPART